LYFALANQKQPNASIKAYADRVKAGLSPDDQHWVDDQVAKLSQGPGGTAVAQGGEKIPGIGVHALLGGGFLLPGPSQITDAATAAKSVGVTGTTPDGSLFAGAQLYYRFSPNIEVNFGLGMLPIGTLTIASTYAPGTGPVSTSSGFSGPSAATYTYNTSAIMASLGGRYNFGDPKMKFYFGLAADISPLGVAFTKTSTPAATINGTAFNSTGNYGTMAIGGHIVLGADFSMGPGLSVGPYLGYQFLSASDFANGADKLMINSDTSDVGPNSQFTAWGVPNSVPLKLDFSNVMGGINVSFSL
jgi:hypothetical protein